MKTKFVTLTILLTFAQFAYAFTVFDPANYVRNTITSIQTIQMEMRQYQQLMEMYKSNIATIKDTYINDHMSNFTKIKALYNSTQSLQNAVGKSQDIFNNAQSLYGAGNFNSWEDFGAVISKRKAAGESSAVNLVKSAEQAQAQMIEANQAHTKLASSLAGVQGVTEASQATASAVGVLIGQNSSLIGIMSAQALEEGRAVSKKQAQETASDTQIKDYLQQKNAELQRFNRAFAK